MGTLRSKNIIRTDTHLCLRSSRYRTQGLIQLAQESTVAAVHPPSVRRHLIKQVYMDDLLVENH